MKHGCEGNEELLSRLVDNDLTPDERREVAAHVLTCEHCAGQTGRAVATKRLLERSEISAEVPAGFMQRVGWRLDGVDGGVNARRTLNIPPHVGRVVAMAAIGLILISGAMMLNTYVGPAGSSSDLLVAAHKQMSPVQASPSGYCPVGSASSEYSWRAIRQSLMRISGNLVTHTMYQIGSCPVSVFDGPEEWNPVPDGDRVRSSVPDLRVTARDGVAIASWTGSGRRYVLVARATVGDVAVLAAQLPRGPGRSPGL